VSALVAKELQEQNKLLEKLIGNYILDKIHPVGSIYISTNNTSPQSLFGGTWERIKDRFLIAAGSTYSAGTTGGSATHTHTLENAWADMHIVGSDSTANRKQGILLERHRSHASTSTAMTFSLQDDGAHTRKDLREESVGTITSNFGTALDGTTDESSNVPPYFAVYMWKRTA
jgi:hypothetical protein